MKKKLNLVGQKYLGEKIPWGKKLLKKRLEFGFFKKTLHIKGRYIFNRALHNNSMNNSMNK